MNFNRNINQVMPTKKKKQKNSTINYRNTNRYYVLITKNAELIFGINHMYLKYLRLIIGLKR